jgi:RNA polymerase sigma factor for flagellar operon FliA
MPYHVEAADLVSCGIFGLIDAIEKFDPSRGIRFETYATPRIRGAIMDELRAIDWVPRSVRAKASEVQHAYSKLQGELRRCPDRAEVALELGVSEDALNRARVQISLTGLVALDELLASPDDDRSTHRGGGVADCSNGPDDVYEVDEAKRLLASAVNRLPNRERLVLTLYYYEGLTQAGIGDALGVSESRICQILAKALRQLRYGIGACGLAADSALLDRFECSA